MLTVAGLGKAFGGRQLFDDLLLALQSGERDAILFHTISSSILHYY